MIIRTEKNSHYTTIANFALNDPQLSLKAKGLWAFIMSKPDEWNINYRGLTAQLKEGQRSILAALKELEEAGYLVRGKVTKKDGKFTQSAAKLYEKPCVRNARTENARTENVRTKVTTEEVKTKQDLVTKVTKGLQPSEVVEKELFNFWAECFGQPIQLNVTRNKAACRRLIKARGIEEAKRLVQTSAHSRDLPYFPSVGDFVTLEAKLVSVESWISRNKIQPSINVSALLYPEKYGNLAR